MSCSDNWRTKRSFSARGEAFASSTLTDCGRSLRPADPLALDRAAARMKRCKNYVVETSKKAETAQRPTEQIAAVLDARWFVWVGVASGFRIAQRSSVQPGFWIDDECQIHRELVQP